MTNVILTINAGSSSIKFAAYELASGALELMALGLIDGIGARATFSAHPVGAASTEFVFHEKHGVVSDKVALGAILDWLQEHEAGARVLAVSHRVVHGGPNFSRPMQVEAETLDILRQFTPLAPLHQPHNIAAVEAAVHAFPSAAQIACFDTAFHRVHPYIADIFALPRRFYEEGVRRYGFHGLSYEYITRRMRLESPVLAMGKVVIAHLGNGASLCATHDGRSIASTMGFTTLDGLPMGTRCGQIDPGVVLYLLTEKHMSAQAVFDLLYKESGLKGISGLSQDMRALEASDSPAAKDAIAYFVWRVRREIGSLAAALGGVDAVVFAGGIGENAWRVRESILRDMDWMGLRLDVDANAKNAPTISAPDSRVTALVMHTDEERMLAEHAAETLGLIGPAAVLRGTDFLCRTSI